MGDAQGSQTQLFMVRIWFEDLGDGKTEWRGQVTYVVSGEVRCFREWTNLIMILQEMLATRERVAKDV